MNATCAALTIKIVLAWVVLLPVAGVQATETHPAKAGAATKSAAAKAPVPDSRQMERELQQMSWQQFRAVIGSIPKMKAEIEAYGPLGWQYVEARYKTYPWKKSIDKLDDGQKRELAGLIRKAGRR